MDEKALSPLVAAVLILAIIVTSVSVLVVQFIPFIGKNAEIRHNEELKKDFLNVVTLYSMADSTKCISLKLGSSFSQSTSSLSAGKSGWIALNLTCNGSSLNLNYSLFRINLSTHNSFIPDQTLVFSEGGVKVYQADKNLTRLNPELVLRVNSSANTLFLNIDNFTGSFQEVSGNGIAFLCLNASVNHSEYFNCTGNIIISDEVFGDEWERIMSNSGFLSDHNTLLIDNPVNISLEIRNFRIVLD